SFSSQILSQFLLTVASCEVRIKVIWGLKQTRCSTSAPTPLTLWTLVKQSRLDPRTPYSFTLDIITRTETVRSRSLESRSGPKSKMRFGRSPRLDLVPDAFSNQTKARYNRSLMP